MRDPFFNELYVPGECAHHAQELFAKTGNMKHFTRNIFFVFSLLLTANIYANGGDAGTIEAFLSRHDLVRPEQYIVTVNPDICAKCRIGLAMFNNRVAKEGKGGKVVYVLRGLREAEVDYYIRHELSFISTESTFIVDDNFFSLIDPGLESRICVFKGRTMVRSVPISDQAEISLEPPYSMNVLQVIDSVQLDESKCPVSTMSYLQVLPNGDPVILDPRYNRLRVFDQHTGKVASELDLEYDYIDLFRKYISSDPTAIEFATRLRPRIAFYKRNEVSLGMLSVNEKNILACCDIIFYTTNEKDDSIIEHFPFLMITDHALHNPKLIRIPYHDLFSAMPKNALAQVDDSTFVFTLLDNNLDKARSQYLGAYTYDSKNETLKFRQLLPVELADFYIKAGINHFFGPNEASMINGKPYYYFNWSIPFVYNDSAAVITYPDTSYMYLTAQAWKYDPLAFEMIRVGGWSKSRVAFFTSENDTRYFSLMDRASGQIVSKGMVPGYFTGKSKYAIAEDKAYIIKMHPDRTMLYTFKLKE